MALIVLVPIGVLLLVVVIAAVGNRPFILSSDPQPQTVEDPSLSFVNSKTEKEGNEMELYALNGPWDLDGFKRLCLLRKAQSNAEILHFVILFDQRENARFPRTPFTSMYGLEQDAMKHIKAEFTFNRVNGFTEITWYQKNMWQSKPNKVKL